MATETVQLSDTAMMRRALQLARRGRGRVSPNPMVGAVLVRGDAVVGEGAHLKAGGPHAEARAFDQAGSRARDATLYVTLEPCAHVGRTPPCSQAVIATGIARVVCAMEDPDPRVQGRGLQALRAAGIQVEVGLLRNEAEALNAAYLKHRREGRPLVILKLGQTLDGRIATRTGASKWITGLRARTHAHRWRSWVDGIIVGAGTILADDPRLTVRHVRGRDPRPLVVDGKLRVSPGARVFSSPGAVLATTCVDEAMVAPFHERGVEVWQLEERGGRIGLGPLLTRAGASGMTSVILEGGAQLAANALRDRVVDQVMIYVAPMLLGEGIAGIADLGIVDLDQAIRLQNLAIRRLGEDVLLSGEVKYCSPG